MKPTFSVIIPTCDRPQLLAEAVDSVLSQTWEDFECLIVDDGGRLPAQTPPDDRVKTIRRRIRGGPAAARNAGIGAAQGRYLAFLDDDDLFTPGRLEAAAAALDKAPISICWQKHLDGPTENGQRLEGIVHDKILDRTTPHLGAIVVDADEMPLLNEEYLACEDLEWWLRASAKMRVTTIPSVDLLIRRHSGPRPGYGLDTRIQFSKRLLDEHSEYFASHRRARAFRWYRIGIMLNKSGDKRGASKAFGQSAIARPTPRAVVRALGMPIPTIGRRM